MAKDLAHSNEAGGVSLITPQQVQSVYKCIGNYVNFTYKKQLDREHAQQSQGAAVAEISNFGTFIRQNSTQGSEFVPGAILATECFKPDSKQP